MKKYAVVVERAERNYAGYVPDLPGCVATGETVEETEALLREAIALHVAGLREGGLPVPEAMSMTGFPRLAHLFGAYMHQDWAVEGQDWPDLVRNFAQGEPGTDLAAVAAEVERLLTDFPEDAALSDQLFRVLGCYYAPRPDLGGPDVRGWLRQVADFLRRGAPAA